MNKDFFCLTTAQFAKLHNVNKRTLHYYDKIGLFSPNSKGENNYRYYDALQSIDFEYIRMFKELNMSIEEIKNYIENPNTKDFIKIVDKKSSEIVEQIIKLKRTQNLLQNKKKQLLLSEERENMSIQIIECEQEELLTAPFAFKDEDLQRLFSYMKEMWGIEQCRAGVGSYISLEKVQNRNFNEYDGLFTQSLSKKKSKNTFTKPCGKYLCGYIKGTWDNLPKMYEKMLKYAREHKLQLTGYAYEKGLNDFAISDENEYVTQILIKIENND